MEQRIQCVQGILKGPVHIRFADLRQAFGHDLHEIWMGLYYSGVLGPCDLAKEARQAASSLKWDPQANQLDARDAFLKFCDEFNDLAQLMEPLTPLELQSPTTPPRLTSEDLSSLFVHRASRDLAEVSWLYQLQTLHKEVKELILAVSQAVRQLPALVMKYTQTPRFLDSRQRATLEHKQQGHPFPPQLNATTSVDMVESIIAAIPARSEPMKTLEPTSPGGIALPH